MLAQGPVEILVDAAVLARLERSLGRLLPGPFDFGRVPDQQNPDGFVDLAQLRLVFLQLVVAVLETRRESLLLVHLQGFLHLVEEDFHLGRGRRRLNMRIIL